LDSKQSDCEKQDKIKLIIGCRLSYKW